MTTQTDEAIQVVAVNGGVGFPSSTRSLTDALVREVAASAPGVSTRTIDVRDLASDIAEATVMGLGSATLDESLRAVERADLVVAGTPVFRGSYAGLFKGFWDLVDPVAMRGKPVLLAATGGSSRHQLMIDQAMRPLFAYFGALVVPTAVYAAKDDFAVAGAPGAELAARVERAGREAARLTQAAARVA
ncbi:CE1759 family FMN reductase [Ruania alba]|uniref:FMN reductase n=1 Tax=Ruania alba TaxID=648782 RepID=A0A1H5F227_9MICO|nr:CE1759 family FMN reductase [Ruania alba]SED97497.1 FMN reductase [Ruania alba]